MSGLPEEAVEGAGRDPEEPPRHLPEKEPFWLFWLRHAWVLVIIAVVMLGCEKRGLTHQWEMFGLDSFLRLGSKAESELVRIIEITDEDYEKVFCGRSPLNAELVHNLILEVAKGGPAVIGVDLDMSSSNVRERIDEQVARMAPQLRPRVVWAQPATLPAQGQNEEPVLLQKPSGDPCHFGLTLFPRDRDGLVRRYARTLEVKPEPFPTLSWSLLTAFRGVSCGANLGKLEAKADDLIFNFGSGGSFVTIDAGSILSGPAPSRVPSGEPAWRTSEALKGKIVLIGGSFGAARDIYFTPLGETPGVRLVARAIESDNAGGGITEMRNDLKLLFDLLAGTLVLFITWRWRLIVSVPLSLGAGFVLTLILSYVLFRSAAYWLSFVPIILGVVVHELWDHAVEGDRIEMELKEASERISVLEQELARRPPPPPEP